MRCSKAHKLISDHIDGLLSAKQFGKLERHLDECKTCRDLYADLESMAVEAKQIKTISETRDLWPSIKKQILDEETKVSVSFKFKEFFSFFSPYSREFVFSASAFLAGILLMSVIYYGMPYVQNNILGPQHVALNQFKDVEYHYEQAIEALNQAILKQNVKLSHELEAVFKENLDIIDNSIRTFRAAIEQHPGDPDATEYLMICYQKKLELLGEMKDLMMQAG